MDSPGLIQEHAVGASNVHGPGELVWLSDLEG